MERSMFTVVFNQDNIPVSMAKAVRIVLAIKFLAACV